MPNIQGFQFHALILAIKMHKSGINIAKIDILNAKYVTPKSGISNDKNGV